ncbi:pre-mRNA-processing factor 17 [[Candida] jaroonii]|uniref:Pre-mRNA-processing factor 17 n=1 Tax=[Candida] jaroonii TaxID=467808 RepID=A0ACA9YD15_9ASCO|nr:pre-mRNA-processing factor 17 [[Candida] jaroonii]
MSLVQGYSSDEDEVPLSLMATVDTKLVDVNPETSAIEEKFEIVEVESKPFQTPFKRGKNKNKRRKGNVEDDYLGPWASYEETPEEKVSEPEDDEETKEEEDIQNSNEVQTETKPTTEYLAKFDYDGSFMTPPPLLGDHECFVPKKVIHTYAGHEDGVNKLQFFPGSGHLILSCGNDGMIRLWDVYNDQELIREYCGHSQPVKDIVFNKKGDRFLSCSFDKKVHLWDTETGEVLYTLKTEVQPTSVMFNTVDDGEFLVGLRNNKIEHYSLNLNANTDAGESVLTSVQTYDYHLGSINGLKPFKEKFLSISDDKSIRIWNYGINIPLKTIMHPTQYSIASVAIHGNDIALQNMNNLIQVLDPKFKFRKKTFRNDNITGYKIDIDFSPDGKIICSGDSKGFLLFWDFKSGKLVKKFRVSNKLINCIKYHPQEQSKVMASGTNGKIYYCD